MFEGTDGLWLKRFLLAAAAALAVFLLVQIISGVVSWRYIGTGITPSDTISVSGHGEVFAAPDIATFTFSVVSDKPTVAAAQQDATALANATTAYLTSAGVATSDIQTSGYSIEPQYSYQNAVCPQAPTVGSGAEPAAPAIYCPPGKSVLTGYEVRQTTTVKVRDLSQAGTLLSGVGTKGATEVSGLNFTFSDPDAVQAQARDKAIADAQSKAAALAKALGVSLVRVVSFNEGNGSSPQPVVYAMAASGSTNAAASPAISPGQSDVTDDVTITYEIR
jgi:uncharacterized protein